MNSAILSGLNDYLKKYFNVYPINLPGFSPDSPALSSFSLNANSDYLEKKIASLKLDKYIVGGISYGFVVVNNAHLDPAHTQAILAMEPYVNADYLQFSPFKRTLFTALAQTIGNNPLLMNMFWQNSFTDKILSFFSHQPDRLSRQILSDVDSSTYLSTLQFILNNEAPIEFKQDIPYVLLINRDDWTITAEPTIKLFSEKIPAKNLLIVYDSIAHFPPSLTTAYFDAHLGEGKVNTIISWITAKNMAISTSSAQ